MEYQDRNEVTNKLFIEKGKLLFSLVIGLFIVGEIIPMFSGNLNLARILLGSFLLYLAYEGYDWARNFFGILSIIWTTFWLLVIIYFIYEGISWNIILKTVPFFLSSTMMASILFFSKDTLAFLDNRKKQPKYPPIELQDHSHLLPQYHELSEKIRSRFNGKLPTYEISTVLPVPNSEDQIIMMNFTEAFRNVFRCDQNGSVIWQAELPTASGDVYTNIQWKESQLIAFSWSCISVILDIESGKIMSPENAA